VPQQWAPFQGVQPFAWIIRIVTTVFERPLRALLLSFHFGFVYEANLDGQAEAECWNRPRYKPVAERACGFR
jgi:hypothetical protein